MKKSVRDRWLADLRSGNFTQRRSSLRDAQGYCCLGVLATQFAHSWAGNDFRMVPVTAEGVCLGGGDPSNQSSLTGALDHPFYQSLGMGDRNQSDFWDLNQKEDFRGVADWVEQNVPVEE